MKSFKHDTKKIVTVSQAFFSFQSDTGILGLERERKREISLYYFSFLRW